MKVFAFMLLSAVTLASQIGTSSPGSGVSAPSASVQKPAQTEDEGTRKAGALLDKMIQALGGQAYLTLQDMEQTGRTYGFTHAGEPAGAGAPFWRFWRWPDKDRIELTKQRDWIIINNGDKGYEITFRGTAPEEADQLEDYLRRRHYSIENVLRVWLKQPGIALFYEGQATAASKPAQQFSILNAQNEGVTFYVDPHSFVPIKKSFTWRDPKTRERTEESEIYDNYRLIQGIMTPLSITRARNGLNTNQRFITTVKYNQGLLDTLFAATVTYDPFKAPELKRK